MARLRPISEEDKERLVRFHARLSEETRYRRYHGAKADLTKPELAYLTEVDHHEHVAVVAERPDGELGAVARVVSNGDGTADVAVVVADDCRGLGLGAAAVREAVRRHATDGPGDEVHAVVQTANGPAVALFVDRLGGERVHAEAGVAIVRLPAA